MNNHRIAAPLLTIVVVRWQDAAKLTVRHPDDIRERPQ
jgi:hypothetical protein